MKRSILYCMLVLVFAQFTSFSGELPKNNKTKKVILSGKITDSTTSEFLAGVKITCTQCNKIVYSDLDGRFFLYLEINADEKLSVNFSQVGYASKSLDLKEIQANASDLYVDLVSE